MSTELSTQYNADKKMFVLLRFASQMAYIVSVAKFVNKEKIKYITYIITDYGELL